jgi:hypothetical protein
MSVAGYKFYDRKQNQEIRGRTNFKYKFVDCGCKWKNHLLIIDYRRKPKLLHVYSLSGKEINIDDGKGAETSSQENSTSQKMAYTALLVIMTEETWFSTLHQSEFKTFQHSFILLNRKKHPTPPGSAFGLGSTQIDVSHRKTIKRLNVDLAHLTFTRITSKIKS